MDFIWVYDSPVGPLTLRARDEKLTGLDFYAAPRHDDAPRGVLRDACGQLDAYFSGDLRAFDLPLYAQGTPFQTRVWAALRDIPYGQTRAYGMIAATVGSPRAARAVGMACNRNPISIIIPCHRVVGADGGLTGFGGGIGVKEKLLRLESAVITGQV